MAINLNGLTTVARLKTFIGITVADDDAILESIINMMSDYVDKYCNRTFKKTTYTNEIYDGNGFHRLLLFNWPIDSDETFTLDERANGQNVSSWSSIGSTLYYVLYADGILHLTGGIFRNTPRHYRVTYTAGYDFDNFTPGNTLESQGVGDLEYAVWKLCVKAFRKRKQSTDITSESIGDYSVSFRASVMADQEVKEILNSYKRPHPN